MDPEYVANQVEYICSIANDDEAAHAAEDSLHKEVLKAISEGTASDPELCAKFALLTANIDFKRWCA